jgi:hypothetical protein
MLEPETAFARPLGQMRHWREPLLTLTRDTLFAVVMIILNGMVGLSLLLGSWLLEGIVSSEFVHMDYGEAIQVLERGYGDSLLDSWLRCGYGDGWLR